MNLYIILLLLFYVSIAITLIKPSSDKKFFCFLSVIIVGMVAFREKNIGVDTIYYLSYFYNPYDGYADGRTMGQIEPAYTALNFLVAWIWKNDYFFIFLTSLLSMLPIIYGIGKFSKYRVLSLFLFFTAGTMGSFIVFYCSMMRQMLSVACLYMSIFSLLRSEGHFQKKIILWFILGVFFHYSAIVLLPFFFIYKLKFNSKICIGIILLTAIIGLSSAYINLGGAVDFIGSVFGRYLGFYFLQEPVKNIMAMIPLLLIAVCIPLFAPEYLINHVFTKLFIIGVCINNIFSQIMPNNCDRFVLPYIISLIWVIPMIYSCKKINRYVRYGIFIVSVFYFSFKLYDTLYYVSEKGIQGGGIVPYESFLF